MKQDKRENKSAIIAGFVFVFLVSIIIITAFSENRRRDEVLVTTLDSISTTESTSSSPDLPPPSTTETIQAPEYQTLRTVDVSFGSVRRIEARIRVPEHYSRTEVEQISKAVISEVTKTQPVNAVMIYIHGPNAPTTGIPNVARVEWAPNGKWSSADQVQCGEYSTFRYSVHYTPPEEAPAQTSTSLTRSSTRGLLNVPLPIGARRISSKPATALEDPEETYQVDATGSQIVEFYVREMRRDGWSVAGWGNSTYEKVFEKGRATMVVMTSAGGKTFTLWGSSG